MLWGESGVQRRAMLRDALRRSAQSIDGLRIGQAVGQACEELEPDVLVVTFEGHPWERIAFRRARAAVPGIVVLGYPHAGSLPGQHSLFRRLGSDLDVDGVLAPGDVTMRVFNRRLPDIPVAVVGSPRRIGSSVGAGERADVCLVLPEGLLSEVEILLDFALEVAAARPDFQFLVRLHPLVSGSSFKLLERLSDHSNIRVSDRSIVEDFAQAKWCLYRGSTMAVMAAAAGVMPIYVHVEGQSVLDPLYELWSDTARPSHAVTSVHEAVHRLDLDVEYPEAVQLAVKYFVPLEPHALSRLAARVRAGRL